jgi:hypothetical protein
LLAERRRVHDVAEDERDRLSDHNGECRPVSGPFLGRGEEQELREGGRGEVVVADEDQ